MMETMRPQFTAGRTISTFEVESGVALDYLPRRLWQRVDETFYDAFRSMLHAIATVLQRPDTAGIPSPSAVRAELGTAGAAAFFVRGGRVEHALDLVTHAAESQSLVGDGTWDEMVEDGVAEGDATWADWTRLPRCENDLEFGMVRERLGLSRDEQWGPYVGDEDEDIEMNVVWGAGGDSDGDSDE